jgi:mitogen-activated protein kinase 1/3
MHSFDCCNTLFIVEDRYQFIKQVGYGAYGVVCSAYDKISQQKVAIKKVGKAF